MKRRIILLLLVFSFIGVFPSYADTVDSFSVDSDTNMLTVSGTPPLCEKNDIISFQLLKGSIDSVTETPESIYGSIITFMQFNAGDNGSYTVDIDMSGQTTGTYTVRLRAGGVIYEAPVYYTNPQDRADVVTAILSAATDAELAAYLDIKNPESVPLTALEIDQAFVSRAEPLKTAGIIRLLIAQEAEPTEAIVKECIINAAVIACIDDGLLSVYDYKTLFGLSSEYLSIYETKLSEEEKAEFTSVYMKGRDLKSFSDVSEAFNDGVILSVFNNADIVSEFEYAFTLFACDTAGYNSLDTVDKLALCEELAGIDFSDTAVLTETVNSKITELKEETPVTPVPSIPASGGGGGGGGGSSSASNPGAIYVEDISPSVPLDTIAPLNAFSDLEGYEWAVEAVNELYNTGIVSGTEAGLFSPAREVKREEFAKMLVLFAESINGEIEYTDSAVFKDVDKDSWYYEYILKGYQAGIIKGISEDAFGAGRNITREDAAVLLYRAAEICGIAVAPGEEKSFTDSSEISDYAQTAVKEFAAAGIISGMQDGSFKPASSCLRAQAAVIIYNTLKAE